LPGLRRKVIFLIVQLQNHVNFQSADMTVASHARQAALRTRSTKRACPLGTRAMPEHY